jgi:transposase InsO family protein
MADAIIAKARDLSGDRPSDDPEQQRRDSTLARFKFRDLADIQARFPFEGLRIEEGVAMYRGRVIVVQPLVFDVLERVFNAVPASLGRQRLLSYMRTMYWGVSASQVARFLATHLVHQEYRHRKRTQKAKPSVSTGPYKVLVCDLTQIDRAGQAKFLLVVADMFTKVIHARAIARKSGPLVAAAMESILSSLPAGVRVGAIRSDNGKEFTGRDFTAMRERHGNIKQVLSTAANPLSNGLAEVSNKTVVTMLFSILDNQQTSVQQALDTVLRVYNSSVHSATGKRPRDLADPSCPASALTAVRERLRKLAAGRDVNRRFNPQLDPGDTVRVDRVALDNSKKALRKGGQFKSSHEAVFSRETFTVKLERRDGLVELRDFPHELWLRGDLLKVTIVADREKYVTEWQGDNDWVAKVAARRAAAT